MASLRYASFILLTVALFLRPAELIGGLEGWPLYEGAVFLCLALSLPRFVAMLRPESLKAQPIVLCVVGLLLAVALSFVGLMELEPATEAVFTFFKVVVSFLLLVVAVDTTKRLQRYLMCLAGCALALTTLALLQFFGLIDNQALAPVSEWTIGRDGEAVRSLMRLSGVGIFGNPNDLARFIVVGIVIALYFMFQGRSVVTRVLWAGPLSVFGYALFLTQSRGGFLALLGSLAVLLYQRLGWVKALALGVLAVPLLFVVFGGRQTDLSTTEGTGQQRIRLWSDGFEALRTSPLFGIGMDHYGELTGGLVAHNSFVHAYVELGLFGGTLFAGAFYLAIWMLTRLGQSGYAKHNGQMEHMRPYILAIIAGYAVGMLSSSRCYAIPTYMLLGLAAVYVRLASQYLRLPSSQTSGRLVARVCVVSMLVFAALQGLIWSGVQWDAK